MASPPFVISITVPGDTDTVSQFPGVDRTNLDKVQSWLLIEHNTYGTHSFVTLPQVGSAANGAAVAAPTPSANMTSIYRNTDKALVMKDGDDSTVHFLQLPPGAIVAYGGASLPNGFLWANGANVSRTTYARLFTAYSTTYGVGDGSTTFGLPDLLERVIMGRGTMGGVADPGRVTNAIMGFDPTVLGSSGGAQNITILRTDLPNVDFVADGTLTASGTSGTTGSGTASGTLTGSASTLVTGNGGTSVTVTIGGHIYLNGNAAVTKPKTMQPTITLNYIIKY